MTLFLIKNLNDFIFNLIVIPLFFLPKATKNFAKIQGKDQKKSNYFCGFTNKFSIISFRALNDVTTLSAPVVNAGSKGAPDAATDDVIVDVIAVETLVANVIAAFTDCIDIINGGVVVATGGKPIGGGSNIRAN